MNCGIVLGGTYTKMSNESLEDRNDSVNKLNSPNRLEWRITSTSFSPLFNFSLPTQTGNTPPIAMFFRAINRMKMS